MIKKIPFRLWRIIIGIFLLAVIGIGLVSYILFSRRQEQIPTKAAVQVNYQLIPPTPPIRRNTEVVFTVMIDTLSQTVNQSEIWLSFESQYMTFVEATSGPNQEFSNITSVIEGNILKITGTSPAGFNGTGVFTLVKFRINDVDPPIGGAQLCSIIAPPTPTVTLPPGVTPTITPTNTPFPTDSLTPSVTPPTGASLTPTPLFSETPTPTLEPSSTPPPTSSPFPTDTPYPTDTPFPTDTPYLTQTPIPTDTPVPFLTELPTAIPTSTLYPTQSITPIPTYLAQKSPVPTAIPRSGMDDLGNVIGSASVLLIIIGLVLKVIL